MLEDIETVTYQVAKIAIEVGAVIVAIAIGTFALLFILQAWAHIFGVCWPVLSTCATWLVGSSQ